MLEPSARERFRWLLRDSLDELMNGFRTGRWCYQQLSKPEKGNLGVVVAINLTREFEIPNGTELDWHIAASDVGCFFTLDFPGWDIPMSMYKCADHGDLSGSIDHPALLMWLNDDSSQWAAGLLRISDAKLRTKTDRAAAEVVRAYGRDNCRRISDPYVDDIFWLWGGVQDDLPENALLHMQPLRRNRIFEDSRSGQARVNALFRETLGDLVRRPTVMAVAQQEDAPKRVRDARIKLRPEGIIIMGHQESHSTTARQLGLLVPEKGEWIAARVTRADHSDPRPKVLIDDELWAIAARDDPPAPGPQLPKTLQEQ